MAAYGEIYVAAVIAQISIQSKEKLPVQRAGHSNVAGSHKYVPTGGINDE